jgi:hypothetical protein
MLVTATAATRWHTQHTRLSPYDIRLSIYYIQHPVSSDNQQRWLTARPPPPAIASYLGGKSTESAIEHRFRPLKVQARALRLMVAKGIDPMDHPVFEWRTESGKQ